MTSTRVVALGGGHGLSVTLRACAPWAEHVTAIVSTADDGGSTGRLRATWDVPGVGDLRRCISALGDPGDVWARLLERRFDAGELTGHAMGNLLLLGLAEELGGLQAACDELSRTSGVDPERARVVPVTDDVIVLCGRTSEGAIVEGQVDVATTTDVREVWITPQATSASAAALDALAAADLVILGPGSLYTSVLAALVVGDVRAALASTRAKVAYVANLRAEQAEAHGYDVAAHVAALERHEVRPDVVVADPRSAVPAGSHDVPVVHAAVADDRGLLHDPRRLGSALAGLVGSADVSSR